jgi:hypothetical protein
MNEKQLEAVRRLAEDCEQHGIIQLEWCYVWYDDEYRYHWVTKQTAYGKNSAEDIKEDHRGAFYVLMEEFGVSGVYVFDMLTKRVMQTKNAYLPTEVIYEPIPESQQDVLDLSDELGGIPRPIVRHDDEVQIL